MQIEIGTALEKASNILILDEIRVISKINVSRVFIQMFSCE